MALIVEWSKISKLHTPAGVHHVEPGSIQFGGEPWIMGGPCVRFINAKTHEHECVPVGAIAGVTYEGVWSELAYERDYTSHVHTSPVADAVAGLTQPHDSLV